MSSRSYSLIIRRIKLENFLSHKNSEIEFAEGVNVIIGENGAGKSSILEGIYFALTGVGWRVGNRKSDLINRRAKSARVILEFEYMKDHFQVVSELGSTRKALLFRNNKIIADGAEMVEKSIKELIGLDPEKLETTVLIAQGGLTELFIQTKPADRKETIDKLLGLDIYERVVGDRLGNLCIQISDDEGPICPSEQNLNYKLEAIRRRVLETHRELMSKRKERDKAIAQCESSIKTLNEKISNEGLREKASRLEEVAKKRDALLQAKSKLEERISRLENEKKNLEDTILSNEKALENITSELKKLEEIAHFAPLLDKLESLKETIKDIENKRQILEGKSRELGKLNSLEPRFRTFKEKYESFEALERLLLEFRRKLDEMRKQLEDLNNEISKKKGFAEKLRSDIENGNITLRKLINEARLDEKEILNNSYLDRVYEEASNNLIRLRSELQYLINRESLVRNQLKDYEERISILVKAVEPKCPVCERPLNEEQRRKLLQDLRRLEEEAHSLLSKLEKDRKQVEEKDLPELEKKLNILEKMKEVIRIIIDGQKTLRQLENDISELAKTKERLERELQELEKQVKVLEKEMVEWQNLFNMYDIEYHLALRKEVEVLRQTVKTLEERAEIIKKELALNLGVPLETFDTLIESIEKKLREAAEAGKRVEQLKYRRETIENNLKLDRERLTKIEEELENAKIELDQTNNELIAVEKEFLSLKKSKELLSELESQIKSYETLLQQHYLEKERIEKDLEKLREKVSKANDAIKKIRILNWLRTTVFHKDGLPEYMRKHYLEVMSRLMESLSDIFDLGFESIKLDEEYNIRVTLSTTRGEPLTINQLSGGEKVAISILALLALHQIVTQGRIGFLALDEPTEYLDEERRRDLVELLKKFKSGGGIPQIIVVSHDNELIEAANIVYKVIKDDFSKVVREGDDY